MNEGYAIFINDDGTETKLSWNELKLEENGKKYGYNANEIKDTSINEYSFYRCEKIKEICIPEGIEYTEQDAFSECKQLEKVTLPSTLKKIDGFCDTAIKEIIIPEGTEIVESYAFWRCKQLKKVTLSSTLKEIHPNSFCDTAIKEINILEGVKYIGWEAFENCKQLEKATLPSTLKELGERSFAGTNIKELIVPNGVEYVGEYALRNCEQLEKVIAPKGLYIPDEIHNGIKVERTDEKYPGYQENLDKVKEYIKEPNEKELNNIQFTVIFLENVKGTCNKWEDFEDVLSILNAKDVNGDKYFDVLEMNDYYKSSKTRFGINYEQLNEEIRQTIKYSEKLGIKPDLKYNSDELKKQYIERIENKLQSLLEEHMEAKNKENERDNMQVLAKEHNRG